MVTISEDAPGSLCLRNLICILDVESSVQHIQYFHSPVFGNVLVLDGEIQHVEAWAPFYHEIVAHLPCSFIPEVGRALIFGGGDLFVARELLKYKTTTEVLIVDHDPAVIEATARVYPAGADTLLDQRLTVLSGSAEDFLAQSVHERYDIIVNDAFDLAEVDSTLPDDLYEAITRFLTDDGVCSDMIYRSIYEADRFSPAMRRVKEQPRKAISLLCVPEHPGFLHVLSLWGRNRRLAQSFKISANPEQRRIRDAHGYRYFDPDNMPYYLYSPPYLADYIK